MGLAIRVTCDPATPRGRTERMHSADGVRQLWRLFDACFEAKTYRDVLFWVYNSDSIKSLKLLKDLGTPKSIKGLMGSGFGSWENDGK